MMNLGAVLIAKKFDFQILTIPCQNLQSKQIECFIWISQIKKPQVCKRNGVLFHHYNLHPKVNSWLEFERMIFQYQNLYFNVKQIYSRDRHAMNSDTTRSII